MILETLAKKFGEMMLGEFKIALIDRLSRVETKIDRIEYDISEMKGELKGLQNRTTRLEFAVHEIQVVLKNADFRLGS